MTKNDFLTVQPVFFKFPGDKYNTYKYIPPKNTGKIGDDVGCIFHNGSHLCNTTELTKTGIRFYAFVFKRQIKGVLRFDSIEPIAESEYNNR